MLHRIVSRYAGVFAAASLGLGLAACEDNTSGTPLPPPPASTAVVVTAVTSPDSGIVDTDAPGPVTFKVTNPNGSAAAGVVVQFAVAGGGIITQSQATSAADGTVSPGIWHLGKKAGTQRITASPPSGNSAVVDIVAVPGPFAALNSPSGLPNSAQIANQATAIAPVFVVADEFNNRAGPGVEVTFEALDGSSIDDTDPIESGDNGDVSPGAWTLDGTIGPQRLVANYEVNGVPVADTITVEAVCSVTRASFGSTINGQWRTTDCDDGAHLLNVYGFSTAAQSSYNATISGAPGQALQLKTPTGVIVQDVLPAYLYSNTSNPYSVAYVVNAGAYESWASAPGLAQVLNSYTINDNGASNGVDNYLPAVGCAQAGNRPFFAMIGVDAFNYFRTTNACNAGGYAPYQDRYLIQLAAGEEFEAVAIQSNALPLVTSLRIRDARTAGGAVVVTGVPAGATGANARTLVADYTVPAGAGGLYEVIVGTSVAPTAPPDVFEYEVIFTTQ